MIQEIRHDEPLKLGLVEQFGFLGVRKSGQLAFMSQGNGNYAPSYRLAHNLPSLLYVHSGATSFFTYLSEEGILEVKASSRT